MLIIGKTFHFDAAHSLPYYKGKCHELHGHTWKLTIELKGEICTEQSMSFYGMIMDYNTLKDIIQEHIIQEFDHRVINEFVHNPTCEQLVRDIAGFLRKYFKGNYTNVSLYSLTLQEGEGGYARFQEG